MPATQLRLALCLALTLLSTPLLADFDQAAAAFASGNYPQALQTLQPLVEQGDARSQYAMGVMYENGFGLSKDPTQAAAWYLKSAGQGNSDAQYNLGAMYEHGIGMAVDYTQAARWGSVALTARG